MNTPKSTPDRLTRAERDLSAIPKCLAHESGGVGRVMGETVEDVAGLRVVAPGTGDRGDDSAEGVRVVLVQSGEEVVGMRHRDAPWCQPVRGEVAEVSGDDHLGFGVDRGGQNVPIVRVGKVELIDQVLVAGYGHIPDRIVHQTAGAIQTRGVEVGAVGAQVGEHLIEIRSVHFG